MNRIMVEALHLLPFEKCGGKKRKRNILLHFISVHNVIEFIKIKVMLLFYTLFAFEV